MSKDVLRVQEYLGHILQAIQRIGSYAEDMDEVAFLGNAMVQDAVILREDNFPLLVRPR